MPFELEGNCTICGSAAKYALADGTGQRLNCPRCGIFRPTRGADRELRRLQLTANQVAVLSGWLREQENPTLDAELVQRLLTMPVPSVAERAKKLLIYMASQLQAPSARFHFLGTSPRLQAAAWVTSKEDLEYLLLNYLMIVDGAVSGATTLNSDAEGMVTLSAAGWRLVEQYRSSNTGSATGFIAMAFRQDLLLVRDALMAGVSGAGYRPVIINREDFTQDKIDDAVLSQIRQSHFIVADFSHQRQNVYYEAGFAEGLGLPIVWTCRTEDIDGLHFDVRQFNFIGWQMDRLDELAERVTNRIGHSIGQGPVLAL